MRGAATILLLIGMILVVLPAVTADPTTQERLAELCVFTMALTSGSGLTTYYADRQLYAFSDRCASHTGTTIFGDWRVLISGLAWNQDAGWPVYMAAGRVYYQSSIRRRVSSYEYVDIFPVQLQEPPYDNQEYIFHSGAACLRNIDLRFHRTSLLWDLGPNPWRIQGGHSTARNCRLDSELRMPDPYLSGEHFRGAMGWQINPSQSRHVELPIWCEDIRVDFRSTHTAFTNMPGSYLLSTEDPNEDESPRFITVSSTNSENVVQFSFDYLDNILTSFRVRGTELGSNAGHFSYDIVCIGSQEVPTPCGDVGGRCLASCDEGCEELPGTCGNLFCGVCEEGYDFDSTSNTCVRACEEGVFYAIEYTLNNQEYTRGCFNGVSVDERTGPARVNFGGGEQ